MKQKQKHIETATTPIIKHDFDPNITQTALPTMFQHLSMLHDGEMPRAIQTFLSTPVQAEIEDECIADYPAPAIAWEQDELFRQWAIEYADAMYSHNIKTIGRFNIIGYLSRITNYDKGKMCFVQWYHRQWRKDKTLTSWTISQIRMGRVRARQGELKQEA